MKNQICSFLSVVLLVVSVSLIGGCGGSRAQDGTMLGAGIGALGGAVVGHNKGRRTAEGAGIGAGIGAVAGYMFGNEQDKAYDRRRRAHYGAPYGHSPHGVNYGAESAHREGQRRRLRQMQQEAERNRRRDGYENPW